MEVMQVEVTAVSQEVLESFEEFYRIAEFLPEILGAIYFLAFVIIGISVAIGVMKGWTRGW